MSNYLYYYRLGSISQLKNIEFANMIFDIFIMIDDFEFDDEHFNTVLTKAKSHLAVMSKLGRGSSEHPLTEVIREKTEQRLNVFRSIKRSAEAAILTGDSVKVEIGKKIMLWMKPHFRDLYRANSKTQKSTALSLRDSMNGGKLKGVEEALDALGCTEMFEKIFELTGAIDVMRKNRSSELTEMKKELQIKRKETYEDLKVLLSTLLNYTKVSGKNQDKYLDLSVKVKDTIGGYNAILQSRRTASQNLKDATAGEDDKQNEVEAVLSVVVSEASDETKIADDNASAMNG